LLTVVLTNIALTPFLTLCSFLFRPLHCLSFFDLRLLVTPLWYLQTFLATRKKGTMEMGWKLMSCNEPRTTSCSLLARSMKFSMQEASFTPFTGGSCAFDSKTQQADGPCGGLVRLHWRTYALFLYLGCYCIFIDLHNRAEYN